MLPYRVKFGLVLVGFLALICRLDAEQAKDAASEGKQVVSSKPATRTNAVSVNFRKELSLPFPSLNTLGPRIDSARRNPDPVALAHAASELAVAEKVSGKNASVTSSQLLKEASERRACGDKKRS